MKAIILISSIFYILGIKISNKIDLIKKSSPVEKIITHTAKPNKQKNSANFTEKDMPSTKEDNEQGSSNSSEISEYK